MTEITMPRLSDSMEEGTILSWLKVVGDAVAQGEALVEIETDKATVTYESPADGTLATAAQVGETFPVGAVIARLGDGDAPAVERDEQPAVATEEPLTTSPATVAANGGQPSDARRATPLARRMAAAHGVDVAALQGSGPGGRVVRADVQAAAGIALAPPVAPPPRPVGPSPAPAISPAGDPVVGGKGEPQIVEPTRLQQVIARRMSEAKATVPEFQVQTEVVMDAALDLRRQLKDVHGAEAPSVNDLIIKAAALALRRHPRANGSYRDGRFELYPRVNVGVAVAAQDALVVPVVMDADRRSLGDIARETRRLAERVRSGQITPPELSGATFTVSNLGMFGMTAIVPVINSPQAAILGVGATRSVLAREAGAIVDRGLMTLTLTCDHRILYGADAARFLSAVRDLLEQPLALAL